MYSNKWNSDIQLTVFDRIFARTMEPYLSKKIVPNHITVLRMFLALPVLYLLVSEQYIWGIALFLFAGATDAFDGSLARTRKQITEWGILYDPLADKMLIGSILFVIVLQHINFFLGMALIIVELGLVIGGWWRKKYGVLTPANIWGKMKMFAEVMGVLILLIALALDIELLVNISEGTLAVALVTAIVSIFAKTL